MFALPADRPALMGILNVTPDSFSDGGLFLDADAAIQRGRQMWEEGADLIDVGGESTRPHAPEVDADEEIRRVLPVIDGLISEGIPVSIDTSKPNVAKVALGEGASVLNDVTGLRDPEMVEVCAEFSCKVCIMHMHGNPRTMQSNPTDGDVVRDVREYLYHMATVAESKGVRSENIWIDPGIGFGKTVRHNLLLLNHLEEFVRLNYPVLVGASRKSFIGKILGGDKDPLPASDRLEGSLAAQVLAQAKGAKILRVHDVKEARRAMELAQAILSA